MANVILNKAKKAKNDEFYTRYEDIESEIAEYVKFNPEVFKNKVVLTPCDNPTWSNFVKFFILNFNKLGLKKVISTCFANNGSEHGKCFIYDGETSIADDFDFSNLNWRELNGNGDFRSDEIIRFRNEADIVVTNPPFSLFREFLTWLIDGKKDFSIIGNMNAITYSEVFPSIKDGKVWLGATNFNVGMYFKVPDGFQYAETYKFKREINGVKVNRVPGCCWFTTIEYCCRHQPMKIVSMADNIKNSKHKEIRSLSEYSQYENADGIDIPFVDSIPSDYDGVMGVPITFFGKFCPEQFKIVGKLNCPIVNGEKIYKRILIKKR